MLGKSATKLGSLRIADGKRCRIVDEAGPQELDETDSLLGGKLAKLGFRGEAHVRENSRPRNPSAPPNG